MRPTLPPPVLLLVGLVVSAAGAAALGRRPPDPGTPPARTLDASDTGDADDGELVWNLVAPVPAVPLRPERLVHADGLSCAECHAEIVQEWAGTAHALAWEDEVYRDAIADRRRPELCHGCHVPQPVLAQGKVLGRPRARDADLEALHFGVSCNSCHVGPGGVYLGPTGAATDAHPTEASDTFRGEGSSALCAACHETNIGPVIGVAKDFMESGMAGEGRSCIGCHMHVDSDTGRRSHALQTPRDPAFLRRAFALSWDEPGKRVSVDNRAGHRVPGLIGRQIVLRAEALDAEGEVLSEGELKINALSYLETRGRLYVELATSGERIRVVGMHEDPRQEEPVEFLREELVPSR